MAVPRIELCDPGSEGQRVAEMLRERGFYVVERSVESLRDGTDAALLLLAGDAEGAVEALRVVRSAAATATTPVILLGEPDLGDPSPEAVLSLGADAHYPRPVPIERLVRKVETFLAPPETRLPSHSGEHPVETDGETPLSGRPEPTMQLAERSLAEWRPPERTLQLSDAEHEELASAPDHAVPLEATPPPEPSARPSRPPTTPPSQRYRLEDAADLSPRLRRLILDADRRVFPAAPPLDLRFAAGDEAAHELVPDELLETVSLPAEPVAEDPLDAFTYLGPVPEHAGTPLPGGSPDPNRQWLPGSSDPGVSQRRSAPPSAGPNTAATFAPPNAPRRPTSPRRTEPSAQPVEVIASRSSGGGTETQDEIGFGEPTAAGRGRRGDLGEADALRLLWRVMEAGDHVGLTIEIEDGPTLSLTIADGELVDMDGPVAQRVIDQLRREGRLSERAQDEEAAVALLERRVHAGLLGRFELDRMMRRAREELLYDAVGSTGGHFEMRPTTTASTVRSRALASPLGAVLVEGARRRLSAGRVRRLLGSGALAMELTPIAHQRFDRAQLEPELVALLERADGAPLDHVLEAAPAEEGVAGAIYALVAASAIRLVASEQEAERVRDPVTAVRDALEAAVAVAEDGCYFDVLGVAPAVAPRELVKAYEGRRREIARLPLALHGLEDLEPRRRLALEVLDEAYTVLSNPRLRDAYHRSLWGTDSTS